MPTMTQVIAMRSASGLSRRGAWKNDVDVVACDDNLAFLESTLARRTQK
jgi:hypothetical protein